MSAAPFPSIRPLPINIGGQLGVDQVIGRDEAIATWWRDLADSSLRLNEPRRLGKSAALNKMVREPPPRWQALYLSFQDINSVHDMVTTTIRSMSGLRSRSGRISNLLQQYLSAASIEVPGASVSLDKIFARRPLDALTSALNDVAAGLDDGERLLLAWDEVPDMIRGIKMNQGPAQAREVLLSLRKFIDSPGGTSIRWIMTGSVGFHHVLRDLPGTESLTNNLGSATLGPLTRGWARWLLACLYEGARIQYDEAALGQGVAATDGIPFLLHHLAKQARDQHLQSVAGVDQFRLMDDFAANEDRSQQLTPMLTRLADFYEEDAATAEWVLDSVAARPMSRDQLISKAAAESMCLPTQRFRDVLTDLKLDHYTVQALSPGAEYAWRYPALSRFWQMRRR